MKSLSVGAILWLWLAVSGWPSGSGAPDAAPSAPVAPTPPPVVAPRLRH
ncbi:hypothetical protein [Candidatus Palauibacter sp.]